MVTIAGAFTIYSPKVHNSVGSKGQLRRSAVLVSTAALRTATVEYIERTTTTRALFSDNFSAEFM